jgi:hypothetical protein
MQAIVSGSNAVSVLFGLNWDRFLFVGAVAVALLVAATLISFQTASPIFI